MRSSTWLVIPLVTLGVCIAIGDSNAQNDVDLLRHMPKTQRDFLATLLDQSNQHKEVLKIKNPVARKEAIEESNKKCKEHLRVLNASLSNEGATDWLGYASVNSGSLGIRFTKGTGPSVVIHVLVKGMNSEVLETVKKIENGNIVRFTISGDAKNPAKLEKGVVNGYFPGQVPAHLLKSLSIANVVLK